MKRAALFDFCGTIANYQTLDPYLEYVLRQNRPKRYTLLCGTPLKKGLALVTKVLAKFGMQCYPYKALLIRQMKGIPFDRLKQYGSEYYQAWVKQNLVAPTIDLLQKLKSEGYTLIIASGGSDMYIQDFAREYGVDHCITARFGFDSNGRCTGKLLSSCLGEDKIRRIKEFLRQNDGPWELAAAFTDSRSDLPMLALCSRRIVVSHGHHQQWATDDMEEILWE